ncbi:MAG TPA: UMP kinase [Candidatus Bathyarchaeia archaeon]|nr:UMP kinase [Candidatus Bathyarchaeia archaeon]
MRVAIKLGGHLFPFDMDVTRISSYTDVLLRLKSEGHQILVVAGGGEVSRKYISTARRLGATEAFCDDLGIAVSRLNASLLMAKLGENAYPKSPSNQDELRVALEGDKITVLGGLQPGQSTNAVAAIAADEMRADLLVNATNVEGVYTSDPKKDPKAKLLTEIDSSRLIEILFNKGFEAGGYELFDMVAAKIVERSKIPTVIIDGRKPENIARVVHGEIMGTRLRYK